MPVRRSPKLALAGTAAFLLALSLPSQVVRPLTAMGPTFAVTQAACGVFRVGDAPWAHGATYKAELTAAGVHFMPALGRRSPRTRSLHVRLANFGRSGGGRLPVMPSPPRVLGEGGPKPIVEYSHAGCHERYEVRADGLAQSFHFDALPAGRGDLVVSLVVDTDLPLAASDAQQVQFVDPAYGGVGLRGVFGIDARNHRVEGTCRCTSTPAAGGGYTVLLSLPAAFVEHAALPLVLDPLLGTVLLPGAGPDDSYMDVAYEPTTDRYLVVWDRSSSLLAVDLVGQRLDGQGAMVGGLLTLRAGVVGLSRNRVVAVDARDAFVAAWSEAGVQTDISAVAIDAATGTVGPIVGIGSPTGNDFAPDLGVASPLDPAAILVWTAPGPTVRGTRLSLSGTGTLTPGAVVDVSAAGLGRDPQVSHGQANGRLLVGYWHATSSRIDGAVLDANLQVLASPTLVPVTAALRNFALDGDGDRWVCASEVSSMTNGDLFARSIEWHAATSQAVVGAAVPVAGGGVTAEKWPSVGWLGGSAAVGFVRVDMQSPTYVTSTAAATLDAVACTPCEAPAIATSLPVGYGHFETRIAVRPQPPGTSSELLLVWNEDDPVAGVLVRARRFRSDDGQELDLGGGCGGGIASHTCARTGNGNYQLRLAGAPAGQPTLLLLGSSLQLVGCGACTIGPDPSTGTVLFVGTVSGSGAAAQNLALPAQPGLVGFVFFQQWLTFAAGAGCSGFLASPTLAIGLQ